MPKYKTNDGTIVQSEHALIRYKGAYKKGQISEILYLDRLGGYYLVNKLDQSVEWYCDTLAIEWLKTNGIWNLPRDLRKVGGAR